jgi:hypothetical protein
VCVALAHHREDFQGKISIPMNVLASGLDGYNTKLVRETSSCIPSSLGKNTDAFGKPIGDAVSAVACLEVSSSSMYLIAFSLVPFAFADSRPTSDLLCPQPACQARRINTLRIKQSDNLMASTVTDSTDFLTYLLAVHISLGELPTSALRANRNAPLILVRATPYHGMLPLVLIAGCGCCLSLIRLGRSFRLWRGWARRVSVAPH